MTATETAPVELRLPPDARYVSLARLVVTSAARQAGMGEARVEDLKVAISEAAANAIAAHERARAETAVVLSFGSNAARSFTVTITDVGWGFDPPPWETLTERDPTSGGGLGLTLIRGLADEVEFVREEGMWVRMRFALELGESAQPDETGTTGDR
jgi:serine/threonine-protein kinase RsbW